MAGYRGYYRFPWSKRALRALPQLAPGRSLRQLAAELRARRLVKRSVDSATVRRALERGKAVQS